MRRPSGSPRLFPSGGIGILALVALAGCTSGLKKPVHEVTAVVTDSLQHVTIKTHTYWFDPNRVVLKAGKEVELKVKNGSMFVPHNLTCFETDAGIEVSANVGMFWGGKTVRFTPTQPGEYEFFCHEDSHAKHGMKGTFVVVP
jgi:plastocyanin